MTPKKSKKDLTLSQTRFLQDLYDMYHNKKYVKIPTSTWGPNIRQLLKKGYLKDHVSYFSFTQKTLNFLQES
jgi:hypothetical protein